MPFFVSLGSTADRPVIAPRSVAVHVRSHDATRQGPQDADDGPRGAPGANPRTAARAAVQARCAAVQAHDHACQGSEGVACARGDGAAGELAWACPPLAPGRSQEQNRSDAENVSAGEVCSCDDWRKESGLWSA